MHIWQLINTTPGQNIDTVLPLMQSFEFVSGGTYFDMDYVFASDEFDTAAVQWYTHFNQPPHSANVTVANRICGENNDGMGVFISGPGINGPYSNQSENIATVPGTNLPVTVRTIRPSLDVPGLCGQASYPQYFNWVNPADSFAYNGYTDALPVKKIPINPCDTYRVRIAVSNAGMRDTSTLNFRLAHSGRMANSAVIIKKHSARTGFWYPAPLQLYDGLGKDTLAEGCPGMILRLVRFSDTTQADSVQLDFQGTAENGVDFDTVSEWAYFDVGQDTTEVLITPLNDNLNEGVENIVIRLMPPGIYPCPVDTTEVEFWIGDRPAMGASIADTFHFNPCEQQNVALFTDTAWGLEPHNFVWFTGDTIDTLITSVSSSGIYPVTVFDACFQDSVVLNTYIDRDYQRMDVSIADIAPNHCPGHTYDLTPEVTGGYQPYSFIWSTGQTTSAIDVAPLETATYTLSVTDSCALDTIVRQVTVNVPDFKPLRILGQDTFHFPCPEGHLDITAYDYYGRGGSGSAADQSHYTFSWDNWLTTRRELQLTVRNDTLLLLQMTDTCHLDTALLNVVVDVYDGPAISASLNDTLHACIGETFVFGPNVTGGVMPYTYRWNDGTRDSSFVLKPEKAKATSKVTITDFCGVNTQEQTTVYATQPMAEFKMTNDSYEPRLFNFENFSEDAISYRWIFGDGAESNLEDPSHSYPDLKAWEVTLIATDTFGCDDQLTKPLEVPLNLFIPNAFTPDGDGKNEVWQPLGYGFKSLGFTIYNRWGNAIFTAPESSQSISGWDGELVPNGVYSYIIVVEPFMERKKEIRGQVQVLR